MAIFQGILDSLTILPSFPEPGTPSLLPSYTTCWIWIFFFLSGYYFTLRCLRPSPSG